MLSPLTASRWDFDAAAHLLVRAGFGGSPEEIQKIYALGPEKAVDSLINAPLENDLPPAWATPDDQDELRAEMQEATRRIASTAALPYTGACPDSARETTGG